MRLKSPRRDEVPEVNLVPMLDVLMSILTFFIVIAMTFTGRVIENVSTPEGAAGEDIIAGPVVVILNNKGEILVEQEVLTLEALQDLIRRYLAQDAQGKIILKADRSLEYTDVASVLETLAKEGGDRISIAVSQ
jgi:biopolymer transport protein ExbD